MPNEMMMNAWIESDDGGIDTAAWPGGESAYHTALRAALAPEYHHVSAQELDALVEQTLEAMPAEDAESFGKFLSNLGRTVAPIAAKVLPVAAPILGTALGGPVGTAIGGTLGRLAGQALGGPAGAAVGAASPRPMPVVPAPVGLPAAAPAAPAAGTPQPAVLPTAAAASAATPALNQLVSFLQNPALLQSLAGRLFGGAGAKAVPVGPGSVPAPFPAFMNALSVLANQAASEVAEHYGEAGEAESTAYLRDGSGSFVYDPAVAEDRAAALLAQLRAGESAPAPSGYGRHNGSADGARGHAVGDWLARAGLVQ